MSIIQHKQIKDNLQSNGLVNKIKQEIQKLALQKNSIKETKQRMRILQQRVRLLSEVKEYSDVRINNLQKIMKHYSTNIFKPTQKYDFQKIKYINEHLTMDRFFGFIKDFNLNDPIGQSSAKNVIQPKKIALLFKKCSSNSHTVDLPEFISLLERLFIQLFDANQNYKKHQKREKLQKQKKRLLAKLRQNIKQEKKRLRFNIQQPVKPTSIKAKTLEKQKKTKKTQIKQVQASKVQSDEDFSIDMQQGLYCFTNEEKIEFYMLRIGIDHKKQIQKKLRSFTKSDYKYYQLQDKLQNEHYVSHPKRQLISLHKEWRKQKKQFEQSNVNRFMDVLDKMSERSKGKSKIMLERSLSKQQYSQIKKQKQNQFKRRQFQLIPSYLKKQVQPSQQIVDHQYSLQMLLHQSSPNQLPIGKISPERYIVEDPTDSIYMKHFAAVSPHFRKRKVSAQQSNIDIVQSTKRRVQELQNQQSQNMKRLANSLLINKAYQNRFLQKRL